MESKFVLKMKVECPRCHTKSFVTCWDVVEFFTYSCRGCDHSLVFMEDDVTTMETKRLNKILDTLGFEITGKVLASDLSERKGSVDINEKEVKNFIERAERGDIDE